MKRYGHLFEKICDFANLLKAAQKAFRGKKDKPRVARFFFSLEFELTEIQRDLLSGAYHPGSYSTFYVFEPKMRHICAADFRDRVVHHAMINVLEPYFDTSLVFDSYACRKGKGSHMAVRRARHLMHYNRFFLKTDIRRFFDSVDHNILKNLLSKKFKDKRLMRLLHQIIDHPLPGQKPGRGMPIGNLTSQWFANFYLSPLDHYIKERLPVKAYVRYMDDLVLMGNAKADIWSWKADISKFLENTLNLKLKERGTFIAPCSEGLPFLGFRIFPRLIRLKKDGITRFRRKLKEVEYRYLSGQIDEDRFIRCASSLFGHVQHADTWNLRQSLF